MSSLRQLITGVTTQAGVELPTRRQVLTLAGVAGISPVLVGMDAALAKKGNKGKKKKKKNNNPDNSGNQQQNDIKNDIDVLNYALTLEHLEYAFYRDGLVQFANNADFPDGVRPRLLDIRDHEKEHVDTLIGVIQSLGGTPVMELCYNFGFGNSSAQFLDVAQLLENTGVMAYTGAVATIRSAAVLTASATIATIEARHASYLNLINGDNPFPDSFDTPKSKQEILAAAGGFIVACP